MEGGTLVLRIPFLALVFLASCSSAAFRPRPVEGGYLFQLRAPGTTAVALTGSFNGWSESASPLTEDSNGLWRIVIPLNKGRHRYMFVVTKKDGEKEWIEPPGASCYVPDGFGGRNGVVKVDSE